ncbi:MAG: hypothetical protein ACSHWQ_05725, partial [Spongiibacteraceae bacterium]
SKTERDTCMQNLPENEWSEAQRDNFRQFLTRDNGGDFLMVNALQLKLPRRENSKLLAKYSNVFLGDLLKSAGHPVLMATAAAANIESLHCEQADNWTAAVMVRSRSRRDLVKMLETLVSGGHHKYKLQALEKTFAFPASPWFILGGARVLVALSLALLAALAHIVLLV